MQRGGLIIPGEVPQQEGGNGNKGLISVQGCFINHRRILILIGFLELILPLAISGLLIYLTQFLEGNEQNPLLLLARNESTCFTDKFLLGLVNGIIFLNILESFLGGFLLYSVKKNYIGQIFSWILLITSAEGTLLLFQIGLNLSGCENEDFNKLTFLRLFLRSLQLLLLLVYCEKEEIKIMRRKVRQFRREIRNGSGNRYSNLAEEENNRNADQDHDNGQDA